MLSGFVVIFSITIFCLFWWMQIKIRCSGHVFNLLTIVSLPTIFLFLFRAPVAVFVESGSRFFEGFFSPDILFGVLFLNLIFFVFMAIGYKRLGEGVAASDVGLNLVVSFSLLCVSLIMLVWFVLNQGGFLFLLSNIANRNELLAVGGSMVLFSVVKAVYFFSALYFVICLREVRSKLFWLALGVLPLVLIVFGGRAIILTFYLLVIYYIDSHFKRVSAIKLGVTFAVALPILMFAGSVRNSSSGEADVAGQAERFAGFSSSDLIVEASYLKREFDFDYLTLDVLLRDDPTKYLFNYFHGFTWLLPRDIYSDKAGILGARLAHDLFSISSYAISYSYMTTAILNWSVLFPFVAFLIGLLLRSIEKSCFVSTSNVPLKVLFLTSLTSLPYALLDPPTFLQGTIFSVFAFIMAIVPLLIIKSFCVKSK